MGPFIFPCGFFFFQIDFFHRVLLKFPPRPDPDARLVFVVISFTPFFYVFSTEPSAALFDPPFFPPLRFQPGLAFLSQHESRTLRPSSATMLSFSVYLASFPVPLLDPLIKVLLRSLGTFPPDRGLESRESVSVERAAPIHGPPWGAPVPFPLFFFFTFYQPPPVRLNQLLSRCRP